MSETVEGIPKPGRRWGGAWLETAKGAWYGFLRKTQLVAPVLSRGRPRPADPLNVAARDPMLRVLRQRAVRKLFDWLGLERLPQGYWTLLERMGDPSRALMAFIANSGFDAMLVRKRDPRELAAFQSFVSFVCQVEESADLVSERQLALLDRHMYYGEHATVRGLLELFVTLNEAVTLFERLPQPYRFAAFARHTRRVATVRESATLADLPEAKALLAISARHACLARRFRQAAGRKEQVEAMAAKGATLSPRDRGLRTSLLSDLARANSALMSDAGCDVEEKVGEFERNVERLAALLDDATAGGRKHGEGEAHRSAHGPSEDALLAMFGFPPGASPDLSALRRAFIREANKTHPVSGQSDYRERNDRFRILKDAYERLKVFLG